MAFYRFTVAQDHSLENESRRRDRYAYPMEALREGIVNAICHRDYTLSGSAIRIFVYKNSCEIRSPGGLPNTLTLESMHYRQFTRNQMIASYLAGYGYMEKRGKGVGLRLGVKTTGCSGMAYVMEYADQVEDDDVVFEDQGVKVLINPKSLVYLDGTELDYAKEGLNEGFQFNNPNVKDSCGCGESFTV